ncbi:MAG: glycosyltransferase family 2 protein [Chitinophagaceae bacterium]|nr:MAG: glycosyltransferase family 2 protein [Chitinophagaceae bacterium]
MRIHVYTLCWNEEKMLPFFIRHYQRFAEKIIFYDNESTDNSRRIIESSDKCEYRTYNSGNELRDDLYRELKNNVWKESRGKADFVIVVDTDEMIYTSYNIKSYLRMLKFFGITLIRPFGYDMISDGVEWQSDEQITKLVKTGRPFQPMNKPCIFNPDLIEEINFTLGAHSCRPTGRKRVFRADWITKYINVGFYLLHYKLMGIEYLAERHGQLKARRSEYNKAKQLGEHYEYTESQIRDGYEGIKAQSYNVI